MQTGWRWLAFEAAWQHHMAPVRERWERRARAPTDELTASQRDYAERRASGLALPYHHRQDQCESKGCAVKCGCRNPGDPAATTPAGVKGSRKEGVRWYSCRRHLTCARCRVDRSVKYGVKIREALQSQYDRKLATSKHALVVMMTIGVRHSGDVASDRRELSAAWRRFRDAYAHRWGRFPFVGVFEVTPGRDELGHVHAHVVCLWPRGIPGSGREGDWSAVRAMWLHAARGRSERVSFEASKRCGDAAGYVSKYLAKGVASDEFSATLAAKVASATYNTRWVFSSRGFWLPFAAVCPACGEQVVRVTFRFSADDVPTFLDWWSRPDRGPPSGHQCALEGIPQADKRARSRRRGSVFRAH